jgi:hypothetical protein
LANERGVAIPFIAVCMVAMIALTAVGIDTGRVTNVATEAQNAADIAATAGTIALLEEEDAEDGANDALNLNKLDGSGAQNYLDQLEVGYMGPDYSFTAGGEPENAVRAVVVADVDNFLLNALGFPKSHVTREAIATFAGLGSGIPTLPVVIGECHFDPNCFEQSCMPHLSQVPSPSDNSGWTAFFENASNSNVNDYMPDPANCHAGGQTVNIKVGDIISMANGQTTGLLRDVECAVNAGITEFTIPIVPCGHQYNQSGEVLGFAKIQVDYVISTGSPKGIWLHGIYEGKQPGPPGGGQFGLLAVSLVK